MASLSINCWNCQGLGARGPNTKGKMAFLEKQFSSRPFDVLALVETRHTVVEDLPNLIHEYSLTHHIVHTPMHTADTCGGIVVIMSKIFDILKTSVHLPGRIRTVTVQHSISQTKYLFTFYYGLHPQHHTPAELKTAMSLLGHAHTSHTNSFIN